MEVAPARNPNDIVPAAGVDNGRDCPPTDGGDDTTTDADDACDGDDGDDAGGADQGPSGDGVFHYPFPDSTTAVACACGRYAPPSRQSAPLLHSLRARQLANPPRRRAALPPVTDGVAALLARPVADIVAVRDEWVRACQRQPDQLADTDDDLGGGAPPIDAVGPGVVVDYGPPPPNAWDDALDVVRRSDAGELRTPSGGTWRFTPSQRTAFLLCAEWVARCKDAARRLPWDDPGFPAPLRAVIIGPAGSGKTFLWRVLADFVNRHVKPADGAGKDATRFTAFTNSAAAIGKGSTVHSSAKIQVAGGRRRGGRRDQARQSALRGQTRVELQSIWAPVRVLWVDEISMIPGALFSHLSARVGDARGVHPAWSLGGIGAVLSGDWLQYAPVGGASLLSAAAASLGDDEGVSPDQSRAAHGRSVYCDEYRSVVQLQGNKRCDEALASVLTSLRRIRSRELPGKRGSARWKPIRGLTPAAKRALAARVLEAAGTPDPRLAEPAFADEDARYIVPLHAQRVQLSYDRTLADARAAGRPVLLCPALDHSPQQDESYYRTIASVPTPPRRLPGMLPLVVGLTYTLRAVVSREHLLAPGTEVVLEGVVHRGGAPPTAGPGAEVPLRRQPALLLVRLPGATWQITDVMAPGGAWPPGVWPLRPDVAHDCELRDPFRAGATLPSFTRSQFPLLPASVLTGRMAQGTRINFPQARRCELPEQLQDFLWGHEGWKVVTHAKGSRFARCCWRRRARHTRVPMPIG